MYVNNLQYFGLQKTEINEKYAGNGPFKREVRPILVRGLRQDLLLILDLYSYFEICLYRTYFVFIFNQVTVAQLKEHWTHYLEEVGLNS